MEQNYWIKQCANDEIDSWNYLHTKPQWKSLRTYAIFFNEVENFVNNDKSEMALNFSQRVGLIDVTILLKNKTFLKKMIENVCMGKAMMIIDKTYFDYYEFFWKEFPDFGAA